VRERVARLVWTENASFSETFENYSFLVLFQTFSSAKKRKNVNIVNAVVRLHYMTHWNTQNSRIIFLKFRNSVKLLIEAPGFY